MVWQLMVIGLSGVVLADAQGGVQVELSVVTDLVLIRVRPMAVSSVLAKRWKKFLATQDLVQVILITESLLI